MGLAVLPGWAFWILVPYVEDRMGFSSCSRSTFEISDLRVKGAPATSNGKLMIPTNSKIFACMRSSCSQPLITICGPVGIAKGVLVMVGRVDICFNAMREFDCIFVGAWVIEPSMVSLLKLMEREHIYAWGIGCAF